MALVRSSYGRRAALGVTGTLVVANAGTTCAEFAGVAAGLELAGVSRYVSVPTAAALIGFVVLRGSFHRIEHVLLLLSTTFVAYVAAAFLAHPDWGETGRGLVVPRLPLSREALIVATGVVGTTLAPWGLAFIQSYAADKRLTRADLRAERVDVFAGAILTGMIGLFVVIACAATLHATGHREIDDARDARSHSSRWRDTSPRRCSASAWSAQRCWRLRSSRSQPPTRSRKRSDARRGSTTRSARRRSSTSPTSASSASARPSSSSLVSRSDRSCFSPRY